MTHTPIHSSARKVIILSRPKAGERIIVQYREGDIIQLDFMPSEAVMDVNDHHLSIVFPDGAYLIVRDFFSGTLKGLPGVVLADGRELTGLEFLEEFEDELLRTYVKMWEHGIGEYMDSPGELVPGVDHLNSLPTIYWARATEPTIEEERAGTPLVAAAETPESVWRFSAAFYEDNMPEQNIYEHGASPVIPGRIFFEPELAEGAAVESVRLSGFPEGALLYLGDPLQGGVLLVPDELGVYILTFEQIMEIGVYMQPPINADKDMFIQYELELITGKGTQTASGDCLIVVDAVADKPDLTVSQMVRDQTAVAPGAVVNVDGTAQFYDVDGSEVFYIVAALPGANWFLRGFSGNDLLSKDAINAYWRNIGGMNDARPGDDVDAALDSIITTGANNRFLSQYLLIEYDPKTGEYTAYGQGAPGQVRSLAVEGLVVDFDSATGVMSFSLPVQAPSFARAPTLHLEILAVALERDPVDQEIIYGNNIAVSRDVIIVDISVIDEPDNPDEPDEPDEPDDADPAGRLTFSFAVHEDGRPCQYLDEEGNVPSTGIRDTSLEDDCDPVYGRPLLPALANPATGLPDEGETVLAITFDGLPAAEEGVLFYNGSMVSAGDTFNNPDLNGFSFLPAENFSGDASLQFSYVVGFTAGSDKTISIDGSVSLAVDSVADLPDAESGGDGVVVGGNDLVAEEYELQEDGWAVQTVNGETLEVSFSLTAKFTDLDGSEEGWIDVLLPQGFSVPPESDYTLITRNSNTYVRVFYGNLAELATSDGEIRIEVTLVMDQDAAPSSTLTVLVGSRELDDLEGGGHSTANNQAERLVEQEAPFGVFGGVVSIKAGWAYEGDKQDKAPADLAALGFDPESNTEKGAPLTFSSSAGEITQVIIVLDDPAQGTFFVNGTEAVPVGGRYVFDFTTMPPDSHITFLPAEPRELYSDKDAPFHYEISLTDEHGVGYTIKGDSLIVLDAVADRPDIDVDPIVPDYGDSMYSAVTPGEVVTVSGKAVFYDLDGSELLYIVVAMPSSASGGVWGVEGLPGENLLCRDALAAYWKEKGGMDAARKGDDVDAVINGILTTGNKNASFQQYLLAEYDPATGAYTVYGQDANGEAQAFSVPGLTLVLDPKTGEMRFSLPVKSPEGALDDDTLHMEIQTVGMEKGQDDEEYVFRNNIAASEEVVAVDVEMRVLRGVVIAEPILREDGQPYQYKVKNGENPATGERDDSFESGYDSVYGMPITMRFVDPATDLPPDPIYGETVAFITIGALPSPDQGILFYQRRPLAVGEVLENPDLTAFSFLPKENFSGDVPFAFSYVITSTTTGPGILAENGIVTIRVDSVADLPDMQSEATGRAEFGNELEAGDYAMDKGWAIQTTGPEDRVLATFSIDAVFTDLDGSEDGWIDVKLPEGFIIPPVSGYEAIQDSTGTYARVMFKNLSELINEDGRVHLDVTLIMTGGASATPQDNTLTIRAVAKERDVLDDDGHSTANNTAVRVITQEVRAALFTGAFTVEAGWTYEGDKLENATPNTVLLGLDPGSTTAFGAPVYFSTTVGTITGVIVTLDDPSQGAFYVNGTAKTAIALGVYEFSASEVAEGGVITFMPSAESLYSDVDVPFHYEAAVTDDYGNSFVIQGDTLVAIDAVADKGAISSADAVAGGEEGALVFTVNAAFKDLDGSERHYILIEKLGGWESLEDPSLVREIVVFYDSYGKPLRPVVYLEDAEEYGYNLRGAVSYKVFFRIDVTARSEAAGGEEIPYEVAMKAPPWAQDATLTTGTLSEEAYPDLNGFERDLGNNLAFDFASVFVNFPDSMEIVQGVPAYEDHRPSQNIGDYTLNSRDGFILVRLSGADEFVDAASANDIVLTFTYAGPGKPGSFTFQGGEYSLDGTPAVYTDNNDGTYSVTFPVGALSGSPVGFVLRYNPPLNDDTDLVNLNFAVPIITGGTGIQTILDGELERHVVDAAADKPVIMEKADVSYDNGHTAAQSGGPVTVNIRLTFDDYDDQSEGHYIVFDLQSGFSSIDASSFPAGYDWTPLTAEQCVDLGLYMFANSGYAVVPVPNAYLRTTTGVFDVSFTAFVDEVSEDTTVVLHYAAFAAENPTDAEYLLNNNMGFVTDEVEVAVNTVTSTLKLKPAIGYEGDHRLDHLSLTSSDPVQLRVSSLDAGESLISLTIAHDSAKGALYYNGTALTSTPVTDGDVRVVYNKTAGIVIVSSISGSGNILSSVNSKLRFMPAEGYSDADVPLTYSGTVLDVASGMTKVFGEQTASVVIDAVAQQPDDVEAGVTYEDGKTAAFDVLTLTASATFVDVDGSEKHFLLIEKMSYFAETGLPSTLVSYGAGGTPLTPIFNAQGDITGWLDPNPASKTDQRVTPTPGSAVEYLLIDVDDVIAQYRASPSAPLPKGFVATPVSGGGYSVSFTLDVSVNTDAVSADFSDAVRTGGMTAEKAVLSGSNGTSGKEGYLYNNVSYDFADTDVKVAVVQTSAVSLLMGSATEQNSPEANKGAYYDPSVTPPSPNGAGLLVVRETWDNALHPEETMTITFTYNAIKEGGAWTLPGSIFYKGQPLTDVAVDQATGKVTAVLTIGVEDTDSVYIKTSGASISSSRIDQSDIRFIPNRYSYNEDDVSLKYTVTVEDVSSGAVADLGGKAGTIVIDAVADKPEIYDVGWAYGDSGLSAFSTPEATLEFTVKFPDVGSGGVQSEGQYILIQQTTTMSLSREFTNAVQAAGYVMDLYPSGGNLYYRVPAKFFDADPPGSHTYKVSLDMIAVNVTGDVANYPAPKILALAIVDSPHGREPVVSNNSAQDEAQLDPLNFAIVSTYIQGGSAEAYEGNSPEAHLGTYGTGTGALFTLGLVVGGSPAPGGKEVVDGLVFTYPQERGMLAYYDGAVWRNVPSGGQVPYQYSDKLRFIPYDTHESDADLDVLLHYAAVARDLASGAQKTINGDYRIVIDAVAEKPLDVQVTDVVYPGGGDSIDYGLPLGLNVSVAFPDSAKSADNHADHYILIQKPSNHWTLVSTGQSPEPQAIDWTHEGTTYFRIPVYADSIGANGVLNMNIVLKAPDAGGGRLLFDNAHPVLVGSLTIDRDPTKPSLPGGDKEITYNNNYAYADAVNIELKYDPDDNRYMTIDDLYENNTPNGNETDENGNPNSTTGGGTVHLPDTIQVDENGNIVSKDVEYVEIDWDSSKGVLVVDGVAYEDGPVIIDKDKFDSVHFESKNPNCDADLGNVVAGVHTTDGDVYNESFYAVTDAVAQPPENITAEPDYGGGNTATIPGKTVSIDVSADFPDIDGSEDHFILVQQMDSSWGNPNNYDIYYAPDGNTYYMAPVESYDGHTGSASVVLTIPDDFEGVDEGDGKQSITLNVGGMSQENLDRDIGGECPRGDEARDDNNTAFNLDGSVTIVVSGAETNPIIQVTDTYAGCDKNGDGTPNLADAAYVYITGLNPASDEISKVVLSYPSDHGALYYNGVELTSGPGVSITTSGGVSTVTITDAEIIGALVDGDASGSAVTYVPKDYNSIDVTIGGTLTVDDKFSSDSKDVSSSDTIIVDAVARAPEDVSMVITTEEGFNGAVVGGSSVHFEVTGSFPDINETNSGSTHYLAVEQKSGWDVDGDLPPGVVIESHNGVTYYLIDVDQYGEGGSDALVKNPDGSYTFSLTLKAPTTSVDISDAGDIHGGAITIADIPGSPDKEITLDNNQHIVTDSEHLAVHVVETTDADFLFEPIPEDVASGGKVTLSPADQATLENNSEVLTSTTFTFSGDFSTTPPGEVAGTMIYDGKAYEIIVGDDGKAAVAVDYGPGGYDPNTDFSVVWGTVATDGSGNVQYVNGEPDVTSWNHTGSDMSVSSSSTVLDVPSGATGTATGSSAASFDPTPDAPSNVVVPEDPALLDSGTEVSFQVSAEFVDFDGSEQHFILVEQADGWAGDYTTTTIDGVSYFLVPVQSTSPNPTVTVTLTRPDDATDETVTLNVGALSYEAGSEAHVIDQTMQIIVGLVTSTGVVLTMPDTMENGEAPMTFSLANPGLNDEITAIVITDLKGGAIIDNSGAPVRITDAPVTLDVAKALAGEYSYAPPEYADGDFSIVFTAVVTDSVTNDSVSFPGQAGTVSVTGVATEPHDVVGEGGTPENQPGHVADIPIILEAAFDDNDGSEEHFFLVTLPDGVLPPSDWIAETDSTLLGDASVQGLTGSLVYRVEAGVDGKASFTVSQEQNTGGGSIDFVAAAMEKSAPGYALSGKDSVTLSATGEINESPVGRTIEQNAAGSSGTSVSGAVGLSDPDGDAVTISGASVNGTPAGSVATPLSLIGDYGVFEIQADGSYTYTRSNSDASGTDVFELTLDDGTGAANATAQTTVTFDVAPQLFAASATAFSVDAGAEEGAILSEALEADQSLAVDFGTTASVLSSNAEIGDEDAEWPLRMVTFDPAATVGLLTDEGEIFLPPSITDDGGVAEERTAVLLTFFSEVAGSVEEEAGPAAGVWVDLSEGGPAALDALLEEGVRALARPEELQGEQSFAASGLGAFEMTMEVDSGMWQTAETLFQEMEHSARILQECGG